MNDDKYIREMFKNIDEDIQIDLEEKILNRIDLEQDHSMILRRYRKFSKIGLWLSISLAAIFTLIYLNPLLSSSIISGEDSLSRLLPTIYAAAVLLFLYIQIEIFKSSRNVTQNRKASQN